MQEYLGEANKRVSNNALPNIKTQYKPHKTIDSSTYRDIDRK